MAVVNAHISRARAEYESIADKRLVHGVAVGYLGSDSAVSDPFCAEVHTHVPLRRFPRALAKARGHALSLLVSRRHEGDHRSMHMLARSSPNVPGALLMARLRYPKVERLLAKPFHYVHGKGVEQAKPLFSYGKVVGPQNGTMEAQRLQLLRKSALSLRLWS